MDLKKALTRQQILISILFVENVLTFIMIIQLIVKPLQIYVSNIKDEKKLEALYESGYETARECYDDMLTYLTTSFKRKVQEEESLS